MGTKKHQERIEELFAKSPVVEFASLRKIIGKSGYAKLYVSNTLRQGKIKKLAKGIYTVHDEIGLAVFAFQPSYLGLQSALSYHGLWEQATAPVIITARKARIGTRRIMGQNVNVRRISKKHFFGFAPYLDRQFYIPYSDVEKTIIDLIAYRQAIDSGVIKKAEGIIDHHKIDAYLKAYPERIRKKVKNLFNMHEYPESKSRRRLLL